MREIDKADQPRLLVRCNAKCIILKCICSLAKYLAFR